MKISELLLESPESVRRAMDIARRVTTAFKRLLPTPTGYLEIELSDYVSNGGRLSETAVGVNKGSGAIGGVYDHPNKMIIIDNAFDVNGLHRMFEQILVHEIAHVIDGEKSKMQAFKPNKIAYPHKPTEINSRFNELIYLLDRKLRGRDVSFDNYLKLAMTMLKDVELNPTDMDNIELHVPKHMRHLPVEATFDNLRPMYGIQHKTFKRIVNRLYANWKFIYNK